MSYMYDNNTFIKTLKPTGYTRCRRKVLSGLTNRSIISHKTGIIDISHNSVFVILYKL